jgi:hypothetical protein
MQGPGGGRSQSADLDPLIGLDDERKPLRSKLLAVPAYRESYLRKVKTIADDWLDWEKLGPVVARYRDLIDEEVEADTRKLTDLEAFQAATSDSPAAVAAPAQGRRPSMSLRAFAEARRKYLLEYPEIKKLDAE